MTIPGIHGQDRLVRNNEFGYSKGTEILPGVPNVRLVPVNTDNPCNLRSVSKLIFDPSSSQVIFSHFFSGAKFALGVIETGSKVRFEKSPQVDQK